MCCYVQTCYLPSVKLKNIYIDVRIFPIRLHVHFECDQKIMYIKGKISFSKPIVDSDVSFSLQVISS